MTSELLPEKMKAFPFCGGHHATVLKHFEDGDYIIYLGAYKDDVRKKCKLHGFGMARYATEEEAIRDWNTRPSPSVERMLPELPDGMLLTECGQEEGEDGWYATCVRVEPYEVYTAHSTSPRAAILAALKLIGGAG